MPEQTLKRKRPPTFQHLPLNRGQSIRSVKLSPIDLLCKAKKLKATWVANTKIKSKWKAQKRKEAMAEMNDETVGSGEREDSDPEPEPPADRRAPRPRPNQGSSQKHRSEGEPHVQAPSTPSLRDLTREAYSRSSLHTFKTALGQRGSPRGTPPTWRKGNESRGITRGETGRGQPNMKLRMNAMLEKIKQDFT